MKLPLELQETNENLLPYDGELYYIPKISNIKGIHQLYNTLYKELEWQPDVVTMFGKTITTKRKMVLYGASNLTYTYSHHKKKALIWNNELKALKEIVEKITQEKFNCCLCNLYHNGNEGMGWHADNEKDLKPHGAIASLSFGAERYFHFKHRKTKEKRKFLLESGSLLLMKGVTQKYWLHALPKSKKITSGRINLTFRSLTKIKY